MLTYTFAFSFVGVFGMIFLKAYENRRRRRVFISNLLSQFDRVLLVRLQEARGVFFKKRDHVYFFLRDTAPRHARYMVFVLKKTIEEKYDNFFPNMRGSRILRKNGDVSSFLRDIAKHKQEQGGGRIEDENIL